MSCIVIQFLHNHNKSIEENIKIHKVDLNIQKDKSEDIIQNKNKTN